MNEYIKNCIQYLINIQGGDCWDDFKKPDKNSIIESYLSSMGREGINQLMREINVMEILKGTVNGVLSSEEAGVEIMERINENVADKMNYFIKASVNEDEKYILRRMGEDAQELYLSGWGRSSSIWGI